MSADSEEEFFELCLHEVLNNLRTKVFNCALKRELRRALRHLFEGKEFGKSLVFQLWVLMLEGEKQKAWRSRLRQYNCRFTASKYHP